MFWANGGEGERETCRLKGNRKDAKVRGRPAGRGGGLEVWRLGGFDRKDARVRGRLAGRGGGLEVWRLGGLGDLTAKTQGCAGGLRAEGEAWKFGGLEAWGDLTAKTPGCAGGLRAEGEAWKFGGLEAWGDLTAKTQGCAGGLRAPPVALRASPADRSLRAAQVSPSHPPPCPPSCASWSSPRRPSSPARATPAPPFVSILIVPSLPVVLRAPPCPPLCASWSPSPGSPVGGSRPPICLNPRHPRFPLRRPSGPARATPAPPFVFFVPVVIAPPRRASCPLVLPFVPLVISPPGSPVGGSRPLICPNPRNLRFPLAVHPVLHGPAPLTAEGRGHKKSPDRGVGAFRAGAGLTCRRGRWRRRSRP